MTRPSFGRDVEDDGGGVGQAHEDSLAVGRVRQRPRPERQVEFAAWLAAGVVEADAVARGYGRRRRSVCRRAARRRRRANSSGSVSRLRTAPESRSKRVRPARRSCSACRRLAVSPGAALPQAATSSVLLSGENARSCTMPSSLLQLRLLLAADDVEDEDAAARRASRTGGRRRTGSRLLNERPIISR